MERMRTLTITGKANISLKPDTTNIILTISHVMPTYDGALERSASEVAELKDILVSIGLKRDLLKTSKFNIDTEYESYRDKNDNYKKKFIGYRYKENIKFSFLNNNEILSKILYLLSKSKVDSEIKLSFTSSKMEESLNEALKEACISAGSKANTIATALGVKLGRVIEISYNDRCNNDIEYERNYDLMDCRCNMMSAPSVDIEPDDIDISDSIDIIYEII